jgi:hypothetical protein
MHRLYGEAAVGTRFYLVPFICEAPASPPPLQKNKGKNPDMSGKTPIFARYLT